MVGPKPSVVDYFVESENASARSKHFNPIVVFRELEHGQSSLVELPQYTQPVVIGTLGTEYQNGNSKPGSRCP